VQALSPSNEFWEKFPFQIVLFFFYSFGIMSVFNLSPNQSQTNNADKKKSLFYWVHQGEAARLILVITMLTGVVLLALMAYDRTDGFFRSFSIAGLLAGAFTLLGGLVGFVFGIPRTGSSTLPNGRESDEPQSGTTDYKPNTSLEEISDWLTKILVGVGLAQLTLFPKSLWDLAGVLGPGLGDDTDYYRVLALSAILFYTIAGFLYSYLWTRLNFRASLAKADLLSDVKNIVQDVVDKESASDALALSHTKNQLNPQQDADPPGLNELKESFASASAATRQVILERAWDVRSKTWEKEEDLPRMERTIPIFQALIEADPEPNHKYHANLGWALKDKTSPQWEEAERQLSKAIEIRNFKEEPGWLFYELNRAICRIELMSENGNSFTTEQVLNDLNACAGIPDFAKKFKGTILEKWLKTLTPPRKLSDFPIQSNASN